MILYYIILYYYYIILYIYIIVHVICQSVLGVGSYNKTWVWKKRTNLNIYPMISSIIRVKHNAEKMEGKNPPG